MCAYIFIRFDSINLINLMKAFVLTAMKYLLIWSTKQLCVFSSLLLVDNMEPRMKASGRKKGRQSAYFIFITPPPPIDGISTVFLKQKFCRKTMYHQKVSETHRAQILRISWTKLKANISKYSQYWIKFMPVDALGELRIHA